ncbi:fibrillin-1-like [Neocloeon triangulifer]|uniref:fibrillin-1-like n=1 Tax=Neocloeon triangulifer TaxID=2078957 RepID=UPI00286F6842|nr:fibrillin-1-like [Neocloeon triangulifer]
MQSFLVLLCLASVALAALNDECDPNVAETCDFKHSVCAPVENSCKCVCLPKYTPDETLTSCVGALGRKCVGKSCQSIPYAVCDGLDGDYTCKCHFNYVDSEDKTVCQVPSMMDRCLEHPQCRRFHAKATCVAERCVCPENTVQNKQTDQCLPMIALGEACVENDQCPENAECLKKTCQCASKHYIEISVLGEQKSCLPVANVVGDACQFDDQCTANLGSPQSVSCGPNSKKCKCSDNFVESKDKTSCLKKASEGESCTQNQQCPEVCNFPVCSPANQD